MKELSKAVAVQCRVFNCSYDVDYKTIGRFFNGLSQAGAWSCLDEFNRIDVEVLSVVTQIMLKIQTALRAGLTHLQLDYYDDDTYEHACMQHNNDQYKTTNNEETGGEEISDPHCRYQVPLNRR